MKSRPIAWPTTNWRRAGWDPDLRRSELRDLKFSGFDLDLIGFEPRITSRDWSSYPILRFSAVPGPRDRSSRAALSRHWRSRAGASCRCDSGVRVRELPMTAERVKAAIGV
jgi:hypothetical protein